MYSKNSEFGQAIRAARKTLGLSLAQAAEGICSASYLSLIEANKRDPTDSVAIKLATRLGLKWEQFEFHEVADGNLINAEVALYAGDIEKAKAFLDNVADSDKRKILLARIESHAGNLSDAITLLSDAISSKSISKEQKLDASVTLCRCLRDCGEIAASIQVGEDALSGISTSSRKDLVLELRLTLVGSYTETGNFFRAKQLVQFDDEILLSVQQQAMLYWSKSMLYQASGDALEASLLAKKSLDLFREADQPLAIAKLEYTSAWLDLQCSEIEATTILNKLNNSEFFLRRNDLKNDLAMCLSTRAELEGRLGNEDATDKYYSEAISLVDEKNNGIRARIFAAEANSNFMLGRLEKSKASLLKARKSLEESGADRSAAGVWRQMAELYEELGDTESVVACLKAATDLVGLAATPIQRTVRTVRS